MTWNCDRQLLVLRDILDFVEEAISDFDDGSSFAAVAAFQQLRDRILSHMEDLVEDRIERNVHT